MDSSRLEMIATSNSVGAESDNSAAALLLEQHQHQQHVDETKTATDNSDRNNNSTTTKSDSKPFQKKNSSENLEPNKKRTAPYPNTGVFDASILMYDNENELEESDVADDVQKPLKNSGGGAKIAAANNNNTKTNNNKLKNPKPDTTTRGGISTTYNQQIADDSLSTLSDKKKKVIVRIVTVFSVIFFLICFAMIAFTLRMSEKIDAQIRKGYSGSNFNSITTKGSNVSLSPSSIGSNSDMLAKMSTMSSSNSRSQTRTTRFVNGRKRRSLFEEIYSSRIKRIIAEKSVKKAATNYSKNYSNKANKHR